ncbi:hypothetical protein [Tardiphaga sp. P5_C7]
MATFNIDKEYSATYSLDKSHIGYVAKGKIYKSARPTDTTFSAHGPSRQATINAAQEEARRGLPPTLKPPNARASAHEASYSIGRLK